MAVNLRVELDRYKDPKLAARILVKEFLRESGPILHEVKLRQHFESSREKAHRKAKAAAKRML